MTTTSTSRPASGTDTPEPVKLWHPADVDPFAQFEDDGGETVAALYAEHRAQQAEPAEQVTYLDDASNCPKSCSGCDAWLSGQVVVRRTGDQFRYFCTEQCAGQAAKSAVPLADALAPYEQKRQARKARHTLPELIADATPRLNHQQGNYGKNRVARRSRRINRRSA